MVVLASIDRLEGIDQHSTKLLGWYDQEARTLPWRYKGSNRASQHEGDQASLRQLVDPYHVWLSEIMLQQTMVKAVIPYFETFISLWPTVRDLAEAPLEDVLTRWAGLGYYARARNLHKCAQHVAYERQGCFPNNEADLLTLPGVGPYTAAAIAAIAFDNHAVVVDGNVERVISRIFKVEQALPESKPLLKQLAGELTPKFRSGDYAQAMMDLGARICTPRTPTCLLCPVCAHCKGLASGLAATLPNRKKKAVKPRRQGACFFVKKANGEVLLHKRPDKGLLAKMTEIPTTLWQEASQTDYEFLNMIPFDTVQGDFREEGQWVRGDKPVEHVFTHFHLTLALFVRELTEQEAEAITTQGTSFYWRHYDALDQEPLPSLMVKVVRAADKIVG